MGCGLTSCPDGLPFHPDKGSNASGVSIGFLQVVTDEFERGELQDIRDRARRLSIPTSARKTEEEWQYKKIADAANILDALYAREESDVKEMESNVTVVPEPVVEIRHGGHRHRPFLGGYGKSR